MKGIKVAQRYKCSLAIGLDTLVYGKNVKNIFL